MINYFGVFKKVEFFKDFKQNSIKKLFLENRALSPNKNEQRHVSVELASAKAELRKLKNEK